MAFTIGTRPNWKGVKREWTVTMQRQEVWTSLSGSLAERGREGCSRWGHRQLSGSWGYKGERGTSSQLQPILCLRVHSTSSKDLVPPEPHKPSKSGPSSGESEVTSWKPPRLKSALQRIPVPSVMALQVP